MRSAPLLMLFFAISLLLDLYAYRVLFRFKKDKTPQPWAKRLFWIINLAAYLGIFGINIYGYDLANPAARNFIIGGFGLLFFTKLMLVPFLFLDDVLLFLNWLYGKIKSKFKPDDSTLSNSTTGLTRTEFMSRLAVLMAGIPFLSLGYGMLNGAYNYKLHRVKLRFPHLPAAFHGVKIVQLSDIHVGSFASQEAVMRGIELVNQQQADYIFFTGDLVNNRTEEVNPWMGVLGALHAKRGIYSILGNHDYGDYTQWPDDASKIQNMEHMIEAHRLLGWRLLRNESVVLTAGNENISLIGVENWGKKGRFSQYGDLQKAKKGTEHSVFKILLSHDPSHFEEEVKHLQTDIDLTLSGHTHGMQFGIEIPGFIKWSPSSWVYRYWAGLYKFGHQYLYVNRGFGFIGYPGRVGILPEITLITLEKE